MRQLLLAIALGFAGAAAQAADIGQVKTASGSAHIERGGQHLAAQIGAGVQEGDKLVTGADGSVGVTFTDNSLLSLGPDSALTIDRYAFDSTTNAGRFDTSLSRGTLAAVSGRIVKQRPEAMRVHTPSSILGVRGTEFVVSIED
jgi:hypothetical protein